MDSEFDIVIAGSGIAGLSAALTAARLGRKVLVLTGDGLGGQLLSINRIDGFPGFPDGVPGYDLCPIVQEQAAAVGAEFAGTGLTSLTAADGGWRIETEAGEQHVARAVVLAMGARLKTLGVPGEERFFGKGVSHCASCDAPLLRGKQAAVVGGGDSAAQEALTLAEAAARVFILHRGPALSAQTVYRDAVLANPKIEVRFGAALEEIVGAAKVEAVRVRSGGAAASLEVSGVFVYIGQEPVSDAVAGVVPLDNRGAILTDGAMRAARRGICAAGAVRAGWLGRAAIAAGEGVAAALAASEFVGSDAWPTT
jgi:thioredoxin reductase (NADPH)